MSGVALLTRNGNGAGSGRVPVSGALDEASLQGAEGNRLSRP